jgi:transposase
MASRRQMEVEFELRNGGAQSLTGWMYEQHSQGASLRTIAAVLAQKTGVQVSHEAVRKWMLEG